MSTLETLATRFARCVDLFRDPGAKEGQKAEFRVLVGLLKDTPVTLRPAAGYLEVNGVRCEGSGLADLVQRLELHGVGEIELPKDPPPGQLFALLAALAEQPGTEDVVSRLHAAGASPIRVARAPSAPREPAPSAEGLASREPGVPPSGGGADRASGSLGTEGILRGESWTDIKSVPISGVPLVTHDPPRPPAADALPSEAGAAAPRSEPKPAEELSLSMGPSAPAPGPPPPTALRAPATTEPPSRPPAAELAAAARAGAGLDRVPVPPDVAARLAELESDPGGANVGDLLAELTRFVESARQRNRLEQLLRVIVGIIGAERRLPEASGARRQYSIALHRIYTKTVLDGLAHLVGAPGHRADAVAALQRAGAAAVEVLMDLLAAAPTVSERRAVFDALKRMTEGTGQLVHMLDHPEWFVARNVAELIGELGMEEAVPALARQLEHTDERVRKAVALALAKIGTRSAAEPLRRALHDRSPEVRIQVALGIGGRKSTALAMPLVVAMQEEKDEAVERELVLALGRIGSPDAVQALIKLAQPAGRLFGRKPSGLRLAAVEALRLAGTPAALGTLEGLSDDSDRQLRAAARAAVVELKRRPRG